MTQSLIWTTKEGKQIPVCDLTDAHVANALRMLRRQALRRRLQELEAYGKMLLFVKGEAASDSIESEMNRDAMMTDDEYLSFHVPLYSAMQEELDKRQGKE